MDGVASERTQEGFADAELLAGMRAGNSAAFATLMRSNNQRLCRLAREGWKSGIPDFTRL